jgi:hypothetical protein
MRSLRQAQKPSQSSFTPVASGLLQRAAVKQTEATEVPPIVDEVLRSPGQPLDRDTRTFMESRFAHDFSRVRVHTDAKAAESARAVNAMAYTVGPNVVFGAGHYTPETGTGKRLLMHELVHTVQQRHANSAPSIQMGHATDAYEREADNAVSNIISQGQLTTGLSQTQSLMLNRFDVPSWESIRNAMYEQLIDALRSVQSVGLSRLRKWASGYTGTQQTIANGIVGAIEGISDILIQLVLAVVGVVVGFGAGIVQTVIGLIRLAIGIIQGILLFLYGFIDSGRRFDEWANGVLEALQNLLPALKALVDNWLKEFEAASQDRQTLMIGELTGQILALIATFEVAAARAGTAPKLVVAFEGMSPKMALATAGGGARSAAGTAIAVDVASPTATTALAGTYAMSISQEGGGGDGKRREDRESTEQSRSQSSESQEINEGISSLKQVYNSLKDAPEYPQDFRPVQNGTRKLSIKNKPLLEELRKLESGDWNKVYRDGYSGGQKVSIHYFQSRSGKVFNVKVKLGWSNLE